MPQPGTDTQQTETTTKKGSKNIVLCFDGTGNEIRATGNTNVVRLFRALENTTGEQIVYYDPGVGTFSSAGASTRVGQKISRTLGLAFGVGIKTNLAEAYAFLMNQWEPGDRIYLFGFSRGAYTARAFAGMLHVIGIPRPAAENLVQYAIARYAPRGEWTEENEKAAQEFSATVCRAPNGSFSVPVHYLGIWDTVSAPGLFRRDLHFVKTEDLPNVEAGRHAVSIDEYRRPYKADLVTNAAIQEAWFTGVHSDVGGGFKDDRLANISLLWVLDGAREHGVLLRRKAELRGLPQRDKEYAKAKPNRMGRIWILAGRTRRPIPPDANFHASVLFRWDDFRDGPDDPACIDDGWCDPEPPDDPVPLALSESRGDPELPES
ncbi:Uncharacterized conserved protein [Rhodococcus gordoniae]|uniref:Uncharacterized conserved protein n=1 Tax=Rhodococcus gordoniae TaxID=223392 RepID=A0A379LXJ9_9NOCA|nr:MULTISPECIES: DUF2235 domain-containing protein [Rhodococcus]SUE13865.1 Uncharacterized conserved protein [Rhodococcus gordoniae]